MNCNAIIAERIKQRRKELQMTQRDLAKAARVALGAISMYENAQVRPSINTMIRIANVLDVSIDWLCGRDWLTRMELKI